jgi:hypothetical protein
MKCKLKPQKDSTSLLLEQLPSRIPPTINVGKVVGKKKPLYTACGKANYYNHYEKLYGSFLKLKIDLSCDPAMPLLGISPKECDSGKYKSNFVFTCTPMFIAALFTMAKLWKQPRCPTVDEWVKKCGTYT